MSVSDTISVAAVLLAAGRSSRMGRPKLLLPWGDTSVIGHLIREWRSIGARQVAVVSDPEDIALARELDRAEVSTQDRIWNSRPEEGMFSSIKAAALWSGWREEVTHCAIALGDQPQIQRNTLVEMLHFVDEHRAEVSQPSHHGRPRHPVFFPRQILLRLRTTETETLKEFLVAHQVALREFEDPGLDLDIDTPEDYERALRRVK